MFNSLAAAVFVIGFAAALPQGINFEAVEHAQPPSATDPSPVGWKPGTYVQSIGYSSILCICNSDQSRSFGEKSLPGSS